jgi:hypothetical protein
MGKFGKVGKLNSEELVTLFLGPLFFSGFLKNYRERRLGVFTVNGHAVRIVANFFGGKESSRDTLKGDQ